MTVAEIRARHKLDIMRPGPTLPSQAFFDRAYLLDLVARMRECIAELAGSPAEHDDSRIDYVTIQVDRGDLGEARALLEESKL